MTASFEAALIWSLTAIIIAVIVYPYASKSRRSNRSNYAEKQEARELGIDKPKAQYPMIDLSLCIGCGSCVRACPEGGVLGLVNGKATIINGFRCVGHGRCADACPVEAVKVGLGDIKTRDDIPFTDGDYQTNVSGLYIIGELGGLALIKNAIKQGTECIEAVSRSDRRYPNPDGHDVVIVGAGPAGLAAALTAKRDGLSYLLLDQQEPGGTILQYPRKKLVLTQPVEIPLVGKLKKSEYTKEELLEIWQSAVRDQSINIRTGTRYQSLRRERDTLLVQANDEWFRAAHVVLALGRRGTPRKLGIPGENQAKVMYQLMDAAQYNNEHLLVVGGGDSAVEAAMALAAQPGNSVTISYRKSKFFRIKKRNDDRVREAVERNAIRVIFDSRPVEIGPDFAVIETEHGQQRIACDFVFIFAGGIPPFSLLRDAGVQFGEEVACT